MAKTSPSPSHPSYPDDAAPVVPSDFNTFEPSVIITGSAGNLHVTTAQGSEVLFVSSGAGQVIPVRVIKVWEDSTVTDSVRIF